MKRSEPFRENELEFPWPRGLAHEMDAREQIDVLRGELRAARAALAREEALRDEKLDASRVQFTRVQEFEHRVLNGMQLIASMLSLQIRAAKSAEAATELTVAAARLAAFGRVHRSLIYLDHQDTVEIKAYLERLCVDLSALLLQRGPCSAIIVECREMEIPTAFASPVAFIVNELTTNAAKYGEGIITVRFETTSTGFYSLSVTDQGSGVGAGFDPSHSQGLGMKIVLSLVKQIGGELHVSPANNDRGTRFSTTFAADFDVPR
jgi:two-component sensor histidine kinase